MWGTIRFVVIDLIGNVVTFPVWWYTVGVMRVLRLIGREVGGLVQSLNLRILFQFLLKPMFGQYDIWGRIISFGVRIVHFFILLFTTVFYTIALSVLLVAWLLLPVIVVLSIMYHLNISESLNEWYASFFVW